jgi:hypothetical protein
MTREPTFAVADVTPHELDHWADLASDMASEVTNPDAENMLQAAALLFRGIAAFQANSEKVCAPRIPHWKVNPIGMLHFLKGAKGKEMSLPAILAREACRTEEEGVNTPHERYGGIS